MRLIFRWFIVIFKEYKPKSTIMKRNLCFAIALLFSSALLAQSNQNPIPRIVEVQDADEQTKHPYQPFSYAEKDINFELIEIGSASNIYTILDVSQNQVHYNAELDIVTFTHRQNTANWDQGGSGVVRYDISTDGGATWTIDELLTPMLVDSNVSGGNTEGIHIETPTGTDLVYGYRYPSGLVLTPSGGTIDDSYIVAMGPTVSTPLGSPWAHNYFASRKLDGSDANTEQIFQVLNNADSGWANIDYMGRGLVKGGDDVYAISSNWNGDATVNLSMYVFWKGTINDSDDDLDWEHHIEFPDFKLSAGNPIVNGNVGAAFNNDGSVGYMIIGGCLNGYSSSLERPVVYKTTDNGDTWVLQAELEIENTEVGVAMNGLPYFRDFDVVVDANDDLHVFAECMQYADDTASFFYEGHMAEFVLSSADNTWSDRVIGDILNSDPGGFLPGSFQDLYTHPQLGITSDGNVLFYAWLETVDDEINDLPDIMARGINISNNTWTEVKNLTVDTDVEGGAIYGTMSPVVISDGDDFMYELPYVSVPVWEGELEETFFSYIKGIGFDASEFTPMSVNELENNVALFRLSPNPTSDQLFIDLELLKHSDVRLTIYNSLGKTVNQVFDQEMLSGGHRLSLSTLGFVDGIYMVELEVDGQRVTKRLIVSH